MKLYNLYQNLILEEIINKIQLIEAVSDNDIDNVIKGDPNKQGKFYHVSFDYKEKDGTVSNRWVQIYQKNISTANNGLIDAYQVSKNGQEGQPDGKPHSATGWKKFRLDRMSNFKVSKVAFYDEPKPYTVTNKSGKTSIAKLNKNGNDSPTVKHTNPNDIAKIGTYQYAASTLKNKANAEKKKQATQKPAQTNQQPAQQPAKPKPSQQQPVKPQPPQQPNVSKNKEEEELNNI